jgi:hypothetical protein
MRTAVWRTAKNPGLAAGVFSFQQASAKHQMRRPVPPEGSPAGLLHQILK